jgi:hypothetical protein
MGLLRRIRPVWWVVIVVAALAVAGTTLFVSTVGQEKGASPVATEAKSQPSRLGLVRSTLRPSDFPRTPPVGLPDGCRRAPLVQANGPWITDFADNQSLPDVVPDVAAGTNLQDFFWFRTMVPTPGFLGSHAAGARDLDAVLKIAHDRNPCAWRLATFVDERGDRNTNFWNMKQVLFDPKARLAHLHAVADEMSQHPLADGMTVDYEYTLPESHDELEQYKILTGQTSMSDTDMVRAMQAAYTQLVRELATVMHYQKRVLRVAVPIRFDDSINTDYPKPSIVDVLAFAPDVDAEAGMAYDIAYASRPAPGPIAPFTGNNGNNVSAFMHYALSSKQLAGKLSMGVPNYGYDWPVNAQGVNPDPQNDPAVDFTASQLEPLMPAGASLATAREYLYTDRTGVVHTAVRTGDQDGEIRFEYDEKPAPGQPKGRHHVAWFAGAGLSVKAGLYHQLCSCGISVWSTGNTDMVGSRNIVAALS